MTPGIYISQERRGQGALVLVFFFLTGLTGLVYELVWIRLLILAFGSTQFAITTVLVTFMAGLALGSFIFGRVVDRGAAPLMVYALIEVVLGLYCIFSPEVFHIVRDLYVALSGGLASGTYSGFEFTQFVLSFAALIIPTTLMGGTLPVMVKYLSTSPEKVGFHTALPYAVNTAGAVLGTVATGFILLYLLGLKMTLYSAGGVDITVGVLLYLMYRSRAAAVTEAAAEKKVGEAGSKYLLIVLFALSGFASLSYEVLWTRVFSLILGSSVYAFTIMLATFLAGISAGSILFAPIVDKLKKPALWFSALEAAIGLSSIFSIFLYRRLPFIFYNLKTAFAGDFLIFHIIQFGLCAIVMLVPTLAMGAIFPLVGRMYTRGLDTVGRNIGDIYFANTAGSIFGSFIAGFVLIPVFGVQTGVVITAALNIAIAVVMVNTAAPAATRAGASLVMAGVFSITVLVLPPWERMVMTMGFYVNPFKAGQVAALKAGKDPGKLLYYREGINAVITVREKRDGDRVIRSYQANGKQEALSIDGRPTGAWSVLGHVPLLLHRGRPERALLVGLGSGITLGAMEYYPLREIDVVEIEPAVVEAARFFSSANKNALADRRVNLYIADGRSFLFASKKKYDVIVSAVSDPWISGVANLFTYEYFTALKKHLADDGIVALWFQNYRITPEELRIGLNTFAAVFPDVSIWFHYTDALDLVVIGTKRPLVVDPVNLKNRFSDGRLREGLSLIGLKDIYDIFDLFLIDNRDLRPFLGRTEMNTDDRPLFEFTLPRHMYMEPEVGVKNVKMLLAETKQITPPLLLSDGEREVFYLALGKSYNEYDFRLGQALRAFQYVLEIDPDNREAAFYAENLKNELNY